MQPSVHIARYHHPADQDAAQRPHCPIPSSSGSGCSTASKLTRYSMALKYGEGESNSILVTGSGEAQHPLCLVVTAPGSGEAQYPHCPIPSSSGSGCSPASTLPDTIIQWIRMQPSVHIARYHHPVDQDAAQCPHCPIPSSSGSGCSTASKLTRYSMALRYGGRVIVF